MTEEERRRLALLDAENEPLENLEAGLDIMDRLLAGKLQCGCDPSSCRHFYLGDKPGPYPRDRRETKS